MMPDSLIRKARSVSLRAPVGNGLDCKVGVFDGLLGYESHDAGSNPNYTRAYGLALMRSAMPSTSGSSEEIISTPTPPRASWTRR